MQTPVLQTPQTHLADMRCNTRPLLLALIFCIKVATTIKSAPVSSSEDTPMGSSQSIQFCLMYIASQKSGTPSGNMFTRYTAVTVQNDTAVMVLFHILMYIGVERLLE